jgi:hypothetical protein
VVCDDGDLCTDDACDPQLGCQTAPHCDDGSACTTDSCDPGTGDCSTTPVVCDDGSACTTDSCDPLLGCQAVPVVCDDGDACTTDSCDPETGCGVTPVSSPAEVGGLLFDADKETLSWTPVAEAFTYDLVRGDLTALPVGTGPGELCTGAIPSATTLDATVPAEGAGFWYLVRGANTCAAPGTYGSASDGTPRVTAACP